MKKLLTALLVSLSLFGCAINHQREIAQMTLHDPLEVPQNLSDDEFVSQISAALVERFPSGTKLEHVIKYVKTLNGECTVESDPHKFPFGQLGPQRDLLMCVIPEKHGLFFRSEIGINAKIENEEITSLTVLRNLYHF